MLGTVLWAKTVLAGVKASAVVLNRVLVAFIVCVQKIFFSWAPDFVDPSVSRNFENRNNIALCKAHWVSKFRHALLQLEGLFFLLFTCV